jgi:hypothetical protein
MSVVNKVASTALNRSTVVMLFIADATKDLCGECLARCEDRAALCHDCVARVESFLDGCLWT